MALTIIDCILVLFCFWLLFDDYRQTRKIQSVLKNLSIEEFASQKTAAHLLLESTGLTIVVILLSFGWMIMPAGNKWSLLIIPVITGIEAMSWDLNWRLLGTIKK